MKHSLSIIYTAVAITAWVILGIATLSCSKATHAEEVTPLPFSHKTHIEKYDVKDCQTCHKYNAIGKFQGLPSIGECTQCHARDAALNAKDHKTPRKKTMFDSYTDRERPWLSRAKNSEMVYFSHKVVMTSKSEDGKMISRCEPCHGDKARANGTAMLSGKPLMGQCMDCHAYYKLNNACGVCHNN